MIILHQFQVTEVSLFYLHVTFHSFTTYNV